MSENRRMERAERIGEKVTTARDNLASLLAAAGIETSPDDTISELTEKAEGIVQPTVSATTWRASAAGYIYPGDFVRKTRELVAETGAELRIAIGAELLDAVTLPDGRIILLMWQDEVAKIKAVKYSGGSLVLGATLELDTVEADAKLAHITDDTAAVFYSADGKGYAVLVTFAELVPTAGEASAWLNGREPCNLAAAQLDTNSLIIAYMDRLNLANGVYVSTAYISTEGTLSISDGYSLSVSTECDTDEYSHALSIAAIDNKRAVVSWFSAHDEPVRFAIVEIGEYAWQLYAPYQASCVYQGSVARTCVIPFGAGVLFANAVARVADGQVTKHLVAIEMWKVLGSGGATPVWYDKIDESYSSSLGLVSATPLNTQEALITWEMDGVARSAIFPVAAAAAGIVPSVSNGTCGTALVPLAITSTGVLSALAHGRDGNVYVSVFRATDVLAAVASAPSNGIAKTKGEPGKEMAAYII